MAKRLQLRRKLIFHPPRPRLINGLRVGTYTFYLVRREKAVLNMERTDFPGDIGYCLDRAMPDPTDGFRPKTGDKIRFLDLEVHVDPGMGDRVVILPYNPNRPMFWLDTEGPFGFRGRL